MGGVGGHGLEGANDHGFDPGILDGARRTGSRFIAKTFKPVLGEAPTPLAYRFWINRQTSRNNLALLAFGTGAVAELVGIECGVVSGVFNLELSGIEVPDWRPRHDKHYHEA